MFSSYCEGGFSLNFNPISFFNFYIIYKNKMAAFISVDSLTLKFQNPINNYNNGKQQSF